MKLIHDQRLISPKLLAIKEKMENEDKDKNKKEILETFWKEIEKEGTPVFEKLESEPDYYLTTFLYRYSGNTNELMVYCQAFGNNQERTVMRRLAGTDIYYNSIYLLPRTKMIYAFEKGIAKNSPFFIAAYYFPQKTIQDKFNKHPTKWEFQDLPEPFKLSILMAPEYVDPKWTEDQGNTSGTFQTVKIKSHAMTELLKLKNKDAEYEFIVYLPDGHNDSKIYPFMLLFDGDAYNNKDLVNTPKIIDNLIAANKLDPIVVVFVFQKNRDIELVNCSEFDNFLVKTVIPELRDKFFLSSDPRMSIVAGSSFGGLMSVNLGLRYPGIFGKVLCQSGYFGYGKKFEFEIPPNADIDNFQYLIGECMKVTRVKFDIYMDFGVYEGKEAQFGVPTPFWTNRHMRDVLLLKGANVLFKEFQGGHDYVMWKDTLADGLLFLLGNSK